MESIGGGSPSKISNSNKLGQSPVRQQGASPLKKHLSVTQKSESTQKKRVVKKKDTKDELAQIELTDPTSVTLQNSFLIKNAGPTFDNYHKAMAAGKKKMASLSAGQGPLSGNSVNLGIGGTMGFGNSSPGQHDPSS